MIRIVRDEATKKFKFVAWVHKFEGLVIKLRFCLTELVLNALITQY